MMKTKYMPDISQRPLRMPSIEWNTDLDAAPENQRLLVCNYVEFVQVGYKSSDTGSWHAERRLFEAPTSAPNIGVTGWAELPKGKQFNGHRAKEKKTK